MYSRSFPLIPSSKKKGQYYTIRTEVIYHAALKSIRDLNSVGFQESPNEGRWVGPPAPRHPQLEPRLAGKSRRLAAQPNTVGFTSHCGVEQSALSCILLYCIRQQQAKLRGRSIKANYWPANSVNCEGGLFAHCAQYRSPLC